jgi:hypothetical protein
MGHKGTRFATMEHIKLNATAKLQNIPKKPSAGASGNGSINGANVCACSQASYFEGD